ncbi:uncharacterized protein LTR77_009949 [Saxophila tyrrhenica]|uniref:NAD(P)-binding protein n=1 Tax=Saxophila tyrrhenica TaxID=1690608 RepID=A0AAV9NZ45_9PEZI|nr:hypothetical protein LTR77_009949 [Saxophila tyrrhenica]
MPLAGADFPRPAEIKTYHINTYDRISPKSSGFDGKGKTVLITGGSDGIGFSIGRAFAAAGVAKIVIVSRSKEPQEKAKAELTSKFPDLDVQTFQASVIDDLDNITSAMQAAGPIDVLVLNAAYSHTMNVPSSTIPTSEIEKTFQANVFTNWHMIQTYIHSTPAPASGSKTVIAVSSAAAHLDVGGQVGYGASKAALSRMIGLLADEYTEEKDNVRIMNYHPGIVATAAATKDYDGTSEPFFVYEHVDLPGDFAVWMAGKEAGFLHGRYLWAQWDVEDLLASKQKVKEDPRYLKIGLTYPY